MYVTLKWWEGFEDVVAPYTQLCCCIEDKVWMDDSEDDVEF